MTTWEVLTYGKKPYKGLRGKQVLEVLEKGGRLDQPRDCPVELYQLMLSCWDMEEDRRPSFREVYTETKQIYDAFSRGERYKSAAVVKEAIYAGFLNSQVW